MRVGNGISGIQLVGIYRNYTGDHRLVAVQKFKKNSSEVVDHANKLNYTIA